MAVKQIRVYLLLIALLLGNIVIAQKSISLHTKNLTLSESLNLLSSQYKIRFAFNDDIFSQIKTNINLDNVSIDEFLVTLCDQYGLKQKYIGGTYVFYIDDEVKIIEAINATLSMDSIQSDIVPVNIEETPVYDITGIVRNKKTGEKLNYCAVRINNKIPVLTNEMGFFKSDTDIDSVSVQINRLGFYEMDSVIQIDGNTVLNILMKPILFESLKSRQIKFVDYIVSMTDNDELISFEPNSTLQIPAVESSDLMNALTIIPGVNYLKGTDVGLSIRGGAPSDNLVLVDGIPMIESNHLMGNLSVLNAKFIDQAFVSRGGFGAEYGGRTAGIVDLSGKTGNNNVPVVDFTTNLLHTNVYVGLPVSNKTSLSGAFKKSIADEWSTFLLNNFALENVTITNEGGEIGEGKVKSTNVNYSDINVKLSIRPNYTSEMTFNLFNSFDSQYRDYSFPIDGNYIQNFSSSGKTTGYSFTYKKQKTNGWLNAFSLGYNKMTSRSEYFYDKEQIKKDELVFSFYDADEIELGDLRANWKSEIRNHKLTHKFGLGFNSNVIDLRYEDHELKIIGANNFNDSISSVSNVSLGNAYYQFEFTPFKWIGLRVGARSLYNITNSSFSIQPRYGIELFPSGKLRFNYSGGKYEQHMYLAYRFNSYKNASSIWYIPNERGQNLDAIHNVAGVKFEHENVLLSIEGYNKTNRNKTYFIGNKILKGGLNLIEYEQLMGEENNRGFDVFFQYRTSIFKHLVSYSLSESYEKVESINNGSYFPSIDHQLHRLRLTEIATYRGWTASVNWYMASGTPYMLNISNTQNLNFDFHNNFMQLDISLVKQFNFQNFYADLGVTILNVLDYRNEIATNNYAIREGAQNHQLSVTKTATAFSPLFYVNFRYE